MAVRYITEVQHLQGTSDEKEGALSGASFGAEYFEEDTGKTYKKVFSLRTSTGAYWKLTSLGLVAGEVNRYSPLPVEVIGSVNTVPTPLIKQLTSVKTSGVTVTRANGLLSPFLNLLKLHDVAVFVLDLTAAATEAGDTLDVYIDLSLDGLVWFNAIHFTQMLGNGGVKRFVAQLTHPTAAVADINVTSDAAAAAARNLWAPHVRVGYAVTDVATTTNAIFSFTVDVYLQGK